MLDNEKIQSVLSKADALAAMTSESFVLAIAAAYLAGIEAGKQANNTAA